MVVEESITPFEAASYSSLPGQTITAVDPPASVGPKGDEMDTDTS